MAEDDSSKEDAITQLSRRLDSLENMIRAQTIRLHAIEQHLKINFEPHQPESTKDHLPPHSDPPAAQRREGAAAAAAATPPPRQNGARDENARRAFDLETLVGGSWFNWIGIIAVTVGVGFFLKLVIEYQWIGPSARVLLGAAVGSAIIIAGEIVRRRGPRQFADLLSGGGILILYLSIYAAYDFYQLINRFPAFVLMTAVTALAVMLSARYGALSIAILALLGGFLTPVLLSTSVDNQAGLFGYVALLDAGVLALAYYKNWRSLNYASFILTLLMITGWLAAHYAPAKLWPTLFFLTLFFLLFSLLAVVHNMLRRRLSGWLDISLVIVNATFYFGTSYALLTSAGYDAWRGSFALSVSAFYLLLFYGAHRQHRADQLLVYSYLGAAVTFFTLAVAVQLDQHWVTIGWAVEALMLTWVGVRAKAIAPRHAGLIVLTVAVSHWAVADAPDLIINADSTFIPLLNRRAASCATLIGVCLAAARLLSRSDAGEGRAPRGRPLISILLVLAASALAFTLLNLDVNDFYEQRIARAPAGGSFTHEQLRNRKEFALSALWACSAAAVFGLGRARGRQARPLRIAALLLVGGTALKLVIVDLIYYDAPWHAPIFNPTFAAFALLVAAAALIVRLYARAEAIDAAERTRFVPLLIIVANLIAVIGLSAEASGYFAARPAANTVDGGAPGELALARQLSLSVIWAVYGGGLLVTGVVRRSRLLRVMGLLLLGVTTLKVFLWDLASLDRIYRIISFIVLGTILLVVSYLYQKKQQRAEPARGR